jgi:hypothetical protein
MLFWRRQERTFIFYCVGKKCLGFMVFVVKAVKTLRRNTQTSICVRIVPESFAQSGVSILLSVLLGCGPESFLPHDLC